MDKHPKNDNKIKLESANKLYEELQKRYVDLQNHCEQSEYEITKLK